VRRAPGNSRSNASSSRTRGRRVHQKTGLLRRSTSRAWTNSAVACIRSRPDISFDLGDKVIVEVDEHYHTGTITAVRDLRMFDIGRNRRGAVIFIGSADRYGTGPRQPTGARGSASRRAGPHDEQRAQHVVPVVVSSASLSPWRGACTCTTTATAAWRAWAPRTFGERVRVLFRMFGRLLRHSDHRLLRHISSLRRGREGSKPNPVLSQLTPNFVILFRMHLAGSVPRGPPRRSRTYNLVFIGSLRLKADWTNRQISSVDACSTACDGRVRSWSDRARDDGQTGMSCLERRGTVAA
jgi:hypothetical protein